MKDLFAERKKVFFFLKKRPENGAKKINVNYSAV